MSLIQIQLMQQLKLKLKLELMAKLMAAKLGRLELKLNKLAVCCLICGCSLISALIQLQLNAMKAELSNQTRKSKRLILLKFYC